MEVNLTRPLIAAFCLLMLIIAASSVQADDPILSKHQIKMYINYDKVLVMSSMLLNESGNTTIAISLPYDARKITDSVDNEKKNTALDGNELIFHMQGNRLAQYSYMTDELTERNTFIASMKTPLDTERLRVELSLPEGAMLARPMAGDGISGSSVYPKPTRLETDGQVINIIWDLENLKQGEETAFYVKYRQPSLAWWIILAIILSAILITATISYLLYRRSHKSSDSAVDTHDRLMRIDHHLKEDEEQIVNILRMKEGSCEQGTLRVATGFSKAKLSGLLKEMEERKVVHKEKRGKRNLVFLK